MESYLHRLENGHQVFCINEGKAWIWAMDFILSPAALKFSINGIQSKRFWQLATKALEPFQLRFAPVSKPRKRHWLADNCAYADDRRGSWRGIYLLCTADL